MKPTRYQRRYRRKKRSPSLLAWMVLALCWLCVIPLAVYVFNRKQPGKAAEEPVMEEIAKPVYQPSSPEQIERHFELSIVRKDFPAVNALRSDEPTVLIYHTHTTEAYTQTESETYKESSKWRTFDPERNVIAVGEALKEILETQYGFKVIHDVTDHEPPKLATAYERSLVTMEKYHKEYPSIVLFIDLHRDAYTTENAPCDYLTINGTETARLMLVVGKGEKYEDKPYFESNAAFAERITAHLNTIDPKLCRPVRIKTGRYNQHVAPNCILVEVGHNANTLSQAKAAMPYLAESIAYAFVPDGIDRADWTPN